MYSCSNESTSTESKEVYTTIVESLSEIKIEVEESYNLYYVLKTNPNITLSISDDSIINLDGKKIIGVKEGKTSITLELNGQKQIVEVDVLKQGSLSSNFDFSVERLSSKKMVAFGDSVTANATIGGGKTYFDLFVSEFGMQLGKNYAIGGTTATYTYPGSNIYKEYGNNTVAIDGCRVVKNAYDSNELQDVDYAFIAYGHNDQYFQAPIDTNNKTYDVNSFDSCHSFKGSYRYMIETLKLANPNIRIILLGCTYSEYDKAYPSPYGKLYNYGDYRLAIKEIADEYNLTYIDPWDYLSLYFDNFDNKLYYKDAVHLSSKGHEILGDYIIKYR